MLASRSFEAERMVGLVRLAKSWDINCLDCTENKMYWIIFITSSFLLIICALLDDLHERVRQLEDRTRIQTRPV